MVNISPCEGRRTPNLSLPPQWDRIASAIADPNFELDSEAFSAIFTVYSQRRRSGHVLDPMLVALMTCLARQAYATEDCIEEGDVTGDLDSHISPAWSAPQRAREAFRSAVKGGRHAKATR